MEYSFFEIMIFNLKCKNYKTEIFINKRLQKNEMYYFLNNS